MVSRSRMRKVFFLVVLLALPGIIAAQDPGPALSDMSDIPEEYEDTIRDLVERYEELRVLLREKIRINTELYTQDEIDAAIEELEAQVAALEEENRSVRQEYKTLALYSKNTLDRMLEYKQELAKTRLNLGLEIDTLGRVIDSIEEETLVSLGATFSPAGSLGAIGILNFPGTTASLIAQGNYHLRERDFTTSFGVGFGLFPQRSIVEGFQRLRNRIRNREEDKIETNSELTTEQLKAMQREAAENAPPVESDEDGEVTEEQSGTLFDPRRTD